MVEIVTAAELWWTVLILTVLKDFSSPVAGSSHRRSPEAARSAPAGRFGDYTLAREDPPHKRAGILHIRGVGIKLLLGFSWCWRSGRSSTSGAVSGWRGRRGGPASGSIGVAAEWPESTGVIRPGMAE